MVAHTCSARWRVAVALLGVALVAALTLSACAAPHDGEDGTAFAQGGPGDTGMGGPGGGMSAGAAVVIADGKLYIAQGGTLYKYDAETLEPEGTVVFAEQTGRPGGAPPGGFGGGPGGPGGPGGMGGDGVVADETNAATEIDREAKTIAGDAIDASGENQSAIWVKNGGSLTLTDATITTSGNSTSEESSSFYGLNAGILASSSTIDMKGGSVSTTGEGANGVFAVGSKAHVTMSDVTVKCTAGGGHAIMATQGGTIDATNVDMDTAGIHGAPIATDRGGGTINVTGGNVVCSGQDSPGIYSTGAITVTGANVNAVGSEGAVIEGANSIILEDTVLAGARKCGAMIYQSMSGDAEGARGVFTMTGGSFTAEVGPLFYVTNTTAIITLTGVECSAASGVLIDASAGRWGNQGRNGGIAVFSASGMVLAGDIRSDDLSGIDVTLKDGTTLTGAINKAALALDAKSIWSVTADSVLTTLTNPDVIDGTTIANIQGNGHTVYYDAALTANAALGGKTYTLAGGGELKPL